MSIDFQEGYATTVTLVMETVQRTQLMARRRQFVQKDTTTARWSKTADMLVSHGSFETAFMNATKNT